MVLLIPRNSYPNQKVADTVPSLSILVPKLLLRYRGVAKSLLPERLVCSTVVLLHDLE